MKKIFHNKKFVLISSAVILVTIVFASVVCFANISITTDQKAKETVINATKGEYGEVTIKGRDSNSKDKIYILAEDTKFKYKINQDSNKFATIISKNLDDFNIEGNVSKDNLEKLAEVALNKYIPVTQNCTYQMTKYIDPSNNSEGCHEFIFNEVATNGVKTGAGISITLNKNGEFIALANHEGNPYIAQNSKPQLDKSMAVKIATDFIKSQDYMKNINNLPGDNTELTVWNNKLAWLVEINGIKGNGSEYGFTIYIDATNGEVLYNDHYSSLQ